MNRIQQKYDDGLPGESWLSKAEIAVLNVLRIISDDKDCYSRYHSFCKHQIRKISLLDEIMETLNSWKIECKTGTVNQYLSKNAVYPAIAYLKKRGQLGIIGGKNNGQIFWMNTKGEWKHDSEQNFCLQTKGLLIEITGIKNWSKKDFIKKELQKKLTAEKYMNKKIHIIPSFLDDDTCNFLIERVRDKFEQSYIIGEKGELKNTDYRTSKTAFLKGRDEPRILAIRKKIRQLIPEKNIEIERLHCVRYEAGEYYRPHYDTLNEPGSEKIRGYSFLVYLNDNFTGGETAFPVADYLIEPQKGKAILYHLLEENGGIDLFSLHEGKPVSSGRKYILVAFLRVPAAKSKIKSKKLSF